MNKRLAALIVSGLMSTSVVLGMAACTPEETETADREAPAFSDPDSTLTMSGSIDTTSANNQISEDLFGLFLEDINYASFALDDNMLINS